LAIINTPPVKNLTPKSLPAGEVAG
jgi:hypothetical protein